MKQSKELMLTWSQKSKCTLDSSVNEKQTNTTQAKNRKTGETE